MTDTDKFEIALSEFTGAPYVVCLNSCTAGILLGMRIFQPEVVNIPCRTWITIPLALTLTKTKIEYREETWEGCYSIHNTPLYDSAKRFYPGMYIPGSVMSLSFGKSKRLSLGSGGAILTDNIKTAEAYRSMRNTGRECIVPRNFFKLEKSFHMNDDIATEGLALLPHVKRNQTDIPWDNVGYPDLRSFKFLKILDRVKMIKHPPSSALIDWFIEQERDAKHI